MPDGNAEQTRMIAEKVAQQMVDLYGAPPEPREAPLHPLIKWLVGTVAALGLASVVGGGAWMVGAVSSMQVTLARMDERQISSATNLADRFEKIDERLSRLEGDGK